MWDGAKRQAPRINVPLRQIQQSLLNEGIGLIGKISD
jgi:hypothetical protein